MSAPPVERSIFHGPPLHSQPGLGALTLPGYLAEVCERYRDREALVFHEGEGSTVRWSYRELYERASGVARALVAAGHPKGGFAAVLMTNRPEWLAAVFGVLLAGGIAVPLSTFSTPSELAWFLKASNASILLFERHVLDKDFAAILSEIAPAASCREAGCAENIRFPFLRRMVMLGERDARTAGMQCWDSFLAEGSETGQAIVEARAATVSRADPALLYFSSGTTGVPKGILNSQRGVAVQLWRWAVQLGLPADGSVRGWGANGFFWSGAFAQSVGAVFSCGGALVLQPTFDAAKAIELFEKEKVNYLTCWPHQYARFPEAPNYATADLSSLKYITRGTAIEEHPTVRTDWIEPVCSYGSTETFTFNCGFANSVPVEERSNCKGTPFPGNAVKIVDPFNGEILPLGQSGEIAVKGATLMLGYVGVPLDETLDDQGFFRTGDGGYLDAHGRLFFEGRLNDIMKTGGANVSPLEIDAILAELAGVKVSQTVGVPHATLGEMIVACVVPMAGHQPEESDLRRELRARLASYKVPRRILFVTKEDLSFTGSAKVRTAALREFVARRLRDASERQDGARGPG